MRLEKLHVHGIGALSDATLDLTAIEPGVVALIGKNGEGKSTLATSFPAALGMTAPGAQTLQQLAIGRDSVVEAQVVNGQPWTIRHTIDRVSGKGEVLVLGEDGRPALTGTGRRAFGAWAKEHFPSEEVFFASTFAAQGSGGFATKSTSDRKACILRLLGVERLEVLAQACREQLRDAKAVADAARARLKDVASRLSSAEGKVAAELSNAESELQSAQERLGQAEQELRAAEAAAADVIRAKEQEAAIQRAIERERGAASRVDETKHKIENNRKLQGDAARVHGARARADELAKLIPLARSAHLVTSDAREATHAACVEAAKRLEAAKARSRELADELARTEQAAAGGAEARAARDELRAVDAGLLEAELEGARDSLETVRGQQLVGAGGRIIALRVALIAIAGGVDAVKVATDALEQDDDAEAATKQHPVDLRFWQDRVADLEARTASERRRQAELQRIADRLPAIEAAEAKLDGLRADKAAADAATATTELDAARDADSAAIAARNGTQAALQELEQEETSLGPWLKLEAPLAAATARITELTELLGEHERELAAAAKEQKDLPQPTWPQARPIPEAQTRLQVAKAEHATTLLKVGQLQATRDTIAPLQAERDERQAEVQIVEDDVSDWQLLADALGRNGIQALEADAAGPELSAIANDLLHNAFGPRFTVRFETTRASADGKELIEDYDVMILDTLKGREGSLDTFSGGEKVILGEAISLALTTLSCRRHGLSDVTLLRDESGASLDAEKSLQYIAMLRRARTLTDARHVIFISHDPATWRLADTRVVVADGTLTVQTEAA